MGTIIIVIALTFLIGYFIGSKLTSDRCKQQQLDNCAECILVTGLNNGLPQSTQV